MPRRYKNKIKVKWKNLFKLVILGLILFIIIKIISLGFNFINENSAVHSMIKITNDIKKSNVVDDIKTTVVNPTEEISKFDPYWNYIKLSLIETDLSDLKKINKDIVGYVQIKNTDLDVPVVYGTKYNKTSLNGKSNKYGWIYLEEYPNADIPYNNRLLINKNNPLYDNLKSLYKTNWKSDKNNYIIKYYNEYYTSLWQIISIYRGDYRKVSRNEILSKSDIDLNGTLSETDNIITISSNSGKNDIIVTAKLLKYKYYEIEEES